MAELNRTQWDEFLAGYPDAHLLQSSAWASLKNGFGWRSRWIVQGDTGAQVLFRPTPPGFQHRLSPQGTGRTRLGRSVAGGRGRLPAREGGVSQGGARSVGAGWAGFPIPAAPRVFPQPACHPAPADHPDPPGRDEEPLLERMKQKTRYNIRLAEKKGVTVRPSADLAVFQKLMESTGQRDGFGVHSLAYFRRAYELFAPRVCGLASRNTGRRWRRLMAFRRGRRAWYFYGASTEAERGRMPAYLLQWEALRWARARGLQRVRPVGHPG